MKPFLMLQLWSTLRLSGLVRMNVETSQFRCQILSALLRVHSQSHTRLCPVLHEQTSPAAHNKWYILSLVDTCWFRNHDVNCCEQTLKQTSPPRLARIQTSGLWFIACLRRTCPAGSLYSTYRTTFIKYE